MKPNLIGLAVLVVLATIPSPSAAQVTDELDAYWAELSRTVEQGDFESYGALYHPDAVLVSLGSGSSYPIAQALAGWKQGFVDTAEGRAVASVDFRLTQRLYDEMTAHETGIFRYAFTPEDGDPVVAPIHFESLLVKQDGEWLMVMEYQKRMATEEEWKAAPAGPAEAPNRLELEQILLRLPDAWNARDAGAWAASFGERSGFTNILGMHFPDRTTNRERHAELFRTIFANSRLEAEVLSIRPVGADAAVAEVAFTLVGYERLPPGVEETEPGVLQTRLITVLERHEGSWLIVAAQNTAILPTAAGRP